MSKQRVAVTFLSFCDFLILPLLIAYLAYEPNFAHGFIDYFESGMYLSYIDGLFRGEIPYKEIYNQFGFLHHAIPAVLMHFFGKTLVVLRGYFMAGEVIGFLVVYLLCRLFLKNRFFAYLAAIFSVMEAHHPFFSTRWGGFRFACGYLSLLGLLLFCLKRRPAYVGWAGFFASVGFLHSEDIGLFSFLTTALFLDVYHRTIPAPEKPVRSSRLVVYYGMGCLAVFLPFLSFLLLKGGLKAYLYTFFSLSSTRTWLQPLTENYITLKVLFPIVVYSVAFCVILYRRLHKEGSPYETLSLLIFSTYGFFSYLYSFRATPGPQFERTLPVTILITFYLLHQIWETLWGREPLFSLGSRTGKAALSVVLVAALGYQIFSEKRMYAGTIQNWLRYQIVKKDYLPFYWVVMRKSDDYARPLAIKRGGGALVPIWQAEEVEKVVDTVEKNSEKNDPLFGFPDLGVFNFFCDRPQISRFYISGFALTKPEWQKELLEALEKHKPPIVLTRRYLSQLAFAIGAEQEILPEITATIQKHYTPVDQTEYLVIYRRSSVRD